MKSTPISTDIFTNWNPTIGMAYENGVTLSAEMNFTSSTISYVVESVANGNKTISRFERLDDAISVYNDII